MDRADQPEAEVDLLGPHPIDQFDEAVRDDGDPQVGALGVELEQEFGDEIAGVVLGNAEADLADPRLFDRADLIEGTLDLVEDDAGAAHDRGAVRGRLDPFRPTHEQRHAEPVLEALDAAAEPRLRDMAATRRTKQVTVLRRGEKVAELLNFHTVVAPRTAKTGYAVKS